MTLMRKTSYSEVEQYLKCGRNHYYSYGLNLRGKYMPEALERGIIGHSALAEYYTSRMAGVSHVDAVAAAFARLADVAAGAESYQGQKLGFEVANLLGLYFDNYRDDPIEVLAVETEYSVGILDDYELPVRVDIIVRLLNTGKVQAWDHKIVKDFYTESTARLKPQLRLYQAGLMTAGIHVDELVYNQLRWRTTNDSKENPSLRFVRLPVPTSPQSVRRTIEEHLMAANRIKAWRAMPIAQWNSKVIRNTLACNMCSFVELCAQDLEGEDTSTLIEFEYAQKTRRSEMNA